jgi:hypothetical protein
LAVAPGKEVRTEVVFVVSLVIRESRREVANCKSVTVGVSDQVADTKPFTIAEVPLNAVTPEIAPVELNLGPWKAAVIWDKNAACVAVLRVVAPGTIMLNTTPGVRKVGAGVPAGGEGGGGDDTTVGGDRVTCFAEAAPAMQAATNR